MAVPFRTSAGNWLLATTVTLLSLLFLEFAARWMLSDIGTTGTSGTYLSRQWYDAHPPLKNRFHFREREFTPSPTPGTIRIAVVGDSFTYAPGIAEEQRVSNLLEAGLNSASGGRKFEVLNFGEPGANYERNAFNLNLALEAARPDFLLLQWYLNDLDDPVDPRPRPYPLGFFLNRALSATSVLYFIAASAFDEAQIRIGSIDIDAYYARFLDPDDPIARRADQRFSRVLDVARKAQVPIAVYLWPELTRPLGANPNDAVIDQFLKRCLVEQIECLDLRPALRAEKQHARLIVNRFDTHASAQANAMAADALLARFGDRWRAYKPSRSEEAIEPTAQLNTEEE